MRYFRMLQILEVLLPGILQNPQIMQSAIRYSDILCKNFCRRSFTWLRTVRNHIFNLRIHWGKNQLSWKSNVSLEFKVKRRTLFMFSPNKYYKTGGMGCGWKHVFPGWPLPSHFPCFGCLLCGMGTMAVTLALMSSTVDGAMLYFNDNSSSWGHFSIKKKIPESVTCWEVMTKTQLQLSWVKNTVDPRFLQQRWTDCPKDCKNLMGAETF